MAERAGRRARLNRDRLIVRRVMSQRFSVRVHETRLPLVGLMALLT